jgi:hypothetical protein
VHTKQCLLKKFFVTHVFASLNKLVGVKRNLGQPPHSFSISTAANSALRTSARHAGELFN